MNLKDFQSGLAQDLLTALEAYQLVQTIAGWLEIMDQGEPSPSTFEGQALFLIDYLSDAGYTIVEKKALTT